MWEDVQIHYRLVEPGDKLGFVAHILNTWQPDVVVHVQVTMY